MTTELIEVKSFFTQELLNKISAYKQSHNFQSLAQAITAVLVEFFDTYPNQISSEKANDELAQRVERLEEIIIEIIDRLTHLEDKKIEFRKGLDFQNQKMNNLFLADIEKVIKQSDDYKNEIESSYCSQLVSDELCSEFRNQIYVSEKPQVDLEQGISGSMLAKRLETNPSTLRKYLRDQKQVQWAAERDPDNFGWIYDPLLQRHYPIQITLDEAQAIYTAAAVTDLSNEHLLSKSVEVKIDDTPEALEVTKTCPDTGLTQAQLSKASGIPTNTLQRWKRLDDCTERIQKRTLGKFLY